MTDDLLKVSRRAFGLAVSSAVAVPACSRAPDPTDEERVFVGVLGELVTDEPRYFNYKEVDDGVLLLGSNPLEGGVGPDQNLVAFLAVCTHMGCALPASSYNQEGRFLECFCHHSRFDLYRGGHQTLGRATQGLVRLNIEVDDEGQIFALSPKGVAVGAPLRVSTIERIKEETEV